MFVGVVDLDLKLSLFKFFGGNVHSGPVCCVEADDVS